MKWRVVLVVAAIMAVAVASGVVWLSQGDEPPASGPFGGLVPVPVSMVASGSGFRLGSGTGIRVEAGAESVGEYLATLLRPATGYRLPVGSSGAVALLLSGADERVGTEGYQLESGPDGVTIRARTTAGLFYGVQTLRQLLPPAVESRSLVDGAEWTVPGGQILDFPRYAYRGFMLDVARHFLGVADVERLIDDIALYKLNRLHLHLTDDQGWRLAVKSWPRLAEYGGETAVGGDPGGYYTQEQYSEIVAYAAARHITVVPEVDLPGHTNAALASYPELNCDGTAPERFTGIDVGFSSLCVGSDLTYRFLDEVFAEVAALTPGEYVHIGGDEARTLSEADYATVVNRAQEIVRRHGKRAIGWHEVVSATPEPTTVAQFWAADPAGAEARAVAAAKGTRLIMSPASRSYLDMKYNDGTGLGLRWAGLVEVRDAYGWDPATLIDGVADDRIDGVEAPLWTETVTTVDEAEYMIFPRLPAIAEVGWSPAANRKWDDFAERLGAQGPRWERMGIDFYRSPQVSWD